jgi:glycosyltransferase involved in cell wall biosynthesis
MNPKTRRPAVSVVIPTFNRRPWLAKTLASVNSQTSADHEIVLVDDGSTDGTAEWVRRTFPEVRVMRLARNQGPAAARNHGIERARGELIAFLDSDDLWREDYLETLTAEFRDPRVVLVFSNYSSIDAKGRVIRRRCVPRAPAGLSAAALTSASMMRRTAVMAAGGFDLGFRRLFEDTDLFIRLALRHGPEAVRLVDRPLMLYRKHAVQLSPALQITTWVRRSSAGDKRDRSGLLDLAHLGFKHRSWLEPMLASPALYPKKTLRAIGYDIFELALSRARTVGAEVSE